VNYKQHLLFGVFCSGVGDFVIQNLSTGLSSIETVVYLGAATFGSLLPDIDHPNSFLGRRIWGWLIPYHERQDIARKIHRKFTHSLAFIIGIAVVASLTGYPVVALGLTVGMVSHLLGDMMTPSGVPLLYPSGEAFRLPIRIETEL
jgi:inner membrane protein